MTTPEDDVFKRIMDNAQDPKYNHLSNYVNPDWYKSETQRAEEAKQELEEWNASCEEYKRKETPIERYCNQILGIKPDYEKTFEEHQKESEDNWNYRMKLLDEHEEKSSILYKKPEGMTVKEWKEKKRLIRLEDKQSDADQKLALKFTPTVKLEDNVRKCFFKCKCTGEGIRNGILCDICKVTSKVNDYMINLFKDAAEGRSSII